MPRLMSAADLGSFGSNPRPHEPRPAHLNRSGTHSTQPHLPADRRHLLPGFHLLQALFRPCSLQTCYFATVIKYRCLKIRNGPRTAEPMPLFLKAKQLAAETVIPERRMPDLTRFHRTAVVLAAGLLASLLIAAVHAQSYPTQYVGTV